MAQTKYLNFGSLYTYCCHGNKKHQITRWLRERIAYVDSMLGFFTSQDDQVTIRLNKTGYVSFEITTYVPLYFNVKWSNAKDGLQTFKLKRGETKTFYYTSTTSTDQEIIIYQSQYIKRLDNLSNLNPSSCILSNAKKLTNVEIHSANLYNIDVTNNTFLRSINLRDCSKLGTVTATGSSLNLSNCKYLKFCDVYNTALTEVQLNSSGGSLTEIYYPKTIQSIQLIKQRLLEVIGLPYSSTSSEIPTSLYTINIQECPSIKKLNTSTDPEIAKSFKAMVYCNNLTIRNSLDLKTLKFDGFYRLRNVVIENMYNLEQIGFNNLLPVGEVSTIKYIGMSNCPKLSEIQLNCTSNNYEITFADNSILNFGKLSSLRSITSNCVLKGVKTIVVPTALESMFFTNEYGSGYSTIENIWVSSVCDVNTDGTSPVVTHVDSTYKGIDFAGMNLKNIDLGALVKIPKAINFKLSPTTVNPHFNLNRDGIIYPYLKPEGVLDLSNYTESLARFFDGVDLDKLQIICNNNLPQTDLSYCFYNSSFSNNISINKLLSKVSSITNLDYCFYQTTINNVDILNNISMGSSSTMNYTFAECPNITSLTNVVIPNSVVAVSGMFSGCPLTSITNMTVNVNGSISGLFKGCNKLTTINTLRIPNVTDISNTFDGCTDLANLNGFELPNTCTNVSNLFKGCYSLTQLAMNFGANITVGDNWYPPNLETLNDTTISNNYVKLTNCTTLKTINNLILNVSNVENFLTGTSSLKNINGITVGGTLTSVAGLFKDKTFIIANNFNFGNTITDFTSCFENCQGITNATIINIANIGNKTMNFSRMFYGCLGITALSNITYPSNNSNLSGMYQNCTNLVSANNLTINSSLLVDMFNGCTALNSVSGLIINNATSLKGMFKGCTLIPSVSFVIPDTVTDISELFYGCTSLIDISGMTFGSGITAITNWNYACPITKANNIAIRNNTVKLSNCSMLKTVNNLTFTENVTNLNDFFYLDTSLTEVSFSENCNTSSLVSIKGIFNGCSSLSNIGNLSKLAFTKSATSLITEGISNAFLNCSSLIELDLSSWDFSKIRQFTALTRGCTSLTKITFPNELSKGFDGGCQCSYAFSDCPKLTQIINLKFQEEFYKNGGVYNIFNSSSGIELINLYLGSSDVKTMLNSNKLSILKLTNVTISTTVTDLSSIFEGNTKLKEDFIIPAHVTNCTNAFKGCTAMTHIHSNWNNSYTTAVTSTDCYSGCTAITHVDEVNIIAYDGDLGLDYLPTDWGGNGFDKENTSIIEITTTTDNYSFRVGYYFNSVTKSSPKVNYGDGTVEVLVPYNGNQIPYHTYAKAGTYRIKGHFLYGIGYTPSSDNCNVIKKIYQIPKYGNGKSNYVLSYAFRGLSQVTYIDISNYASENNTSLISTFANCSKLETIIGLSSLNTSKVNDMSGVFSGCPFTSIDLSSWNMTNVSSTASMFENCTKLITVTGITTSNKLKTINRMFYGCTCLESINEFDTSGVISMGGNEQGIFQYCSSLVSIPNFDYSSITSISRAFYETKKLQIVNFTNMKAISGFNDGYNNGTCFNGCTALTEINGINLEGLDYQGYLYNMNFAGLVVDNAPLLTTISLKPNTKIKIGNTMSGAYLGVRFLNCNALSVTTLVNIINALYSYVGQTARILDIGAINLAKLTPAQIKIATDKNWTVV